MHKSIQRLGFEFNGQFCAIQYSCAIEDSLTTIITRNVKDFKKATIKVIAPETFLTKPN